MNSDLNKVDLSPEEWAVVVISLEMRRDHWRTIADQGTLYGVAVVSYAVKQIAVIENTLQKLGRNG